MHSLEIPSRILLEVYAVSQLCFQRFVLRAIITSKGACSEPCLQSCASRAELLDLHVQSLVIMFRELHSSTMLPEL